MKVTEHQHQKTFFEWAKAKERLYPDLRWMFAVPNGGHRHASVGAKLKREGVKAGVLDVWLPVPRGRYNGFVGEFKVNPNRLTPLQREWATALRENGYAVFVAYHWEDMAHEVEMYLNFPDIRK